MFPWVEFLKSRPWNDECVQGVFQDLESWILASGVNTCERKGRKEGIGGGAGPGANPTGNSRPEMALQSCPTLGPSYPHQTSDGGCACRGCGSGWSGCQLMCLEGPDSSSSNSGNKSCTFSGESGQCVPASPSRHWHYKSTSLVSLLTICLSVVTKFSCNI